MRMAMALVDGNSFFCSCERLFRPDLEGWPVIVLSNNDGCVVSRTPEARALGIPMGAPFFKVRELCQRHAVAVFSSNFELYSDLSRRLMDVLASTARRLQVYSVDEAFLDLSGGGPDWELEGLRIKAKVERWLGLPVGVGVAPTKVLAKVANRLAKRTGGVYSLMEEKEQLRVLRELPVEEIWGVGPGRLAKLKALGIRTALELRNFENEKLLMRQLTKLGLVLRDELRGVTCLPLEEGGEKKQEILCSRSFGQAVRSKEELKEAVASHVASAAFKLRAQGSVCRALEVFYATGRFGQDLPQEAYLHRRLEAPTNDTLTLTSMALEMVEESFRFGPSYKKAGVRVSELLDESEAQLSLFSSPSLSPSREVLMRAMDSINQRFGRNTLKSAALGSSRHKRLWERRCELRSLPYTTSAQLREVF